MIVNDCKSTLVTINKNKGVSKDCYNYQGVKLMSYIMIL